MITAYGIPLVPVSSFKYLGRVMLASDDDWPAVEQNLRREQQKWERLTRVLEREGVDAWTSGRIYMVVVQAVLLYGSQMWVMTPCIGRVWGGFCHRVARRLKGWQSWRRIDRRLLYTPLVG